MFGRLLGVAGTVLVIAVAVVTPALLSSAPAGADTVVEGCTIVSNPTPTNFTNCPGVRLLNANLSGLPALLVQVGSDETLLDDAVRIVRKAAGADVAVSLEVWPHMIHAWHLWAAELADARRAIASAGAFIHAHL